MRFLFKNFGSIFISLVLALLVWVAAVREQNPPRESDYNQPVHIEVVPPPDGLVNTALVPETVRLRLLAPQRSWAALSPSKFKATLDLSNVGTGLSDVPVEVQISDSLVEIIEQAPSVVGVNIEAVKTISMPVEIEVLDSPPLGYVHRLPAADPAVVVISGPASQVNKVERATTEVFIRNSKETIQTVREVIAREENGQMVRQVDIEPPALEITIPIEQRFGYKDVSVRVTVEGQVAPGYRVSNIRVDPPTLTVVGNPKGLAQIAGVVETVPVNLNQATEDIVRTVPLNLPDGVTIVASEEEKSGPEGVQVTVEITPIEDGITLERPITQQGINPDYWWQAMPDRANVFLSGPLTQLQSLRASDVEVLVDLFDLAPGVHVLQPTVFKPEGLRLDAIVPDTIEVTIGRTVQRPITEQGLNPRYTWQASPNNINVLLSEEASRLKSIQPGDIEVTVDLTGLGPGFYKVQPNVSLPDGLAIDSISPNTVNVSIDQKFGVSKRATVTPTSAVTTPVESASTSEPDTKATPQLKEDN